MRSWARCFLAALIFPLCAPAFSQSGDEVWIRLLRAVEYSNLARASFVVPCQYGSQTRERLKAVCEKLNDISDEVIESAALPYIKLHVAPDVAEQALEFWSSDRGRALSWRICAEIRSGKHDHLDESDLRLIELIGKTSYGRALNEFGADKKANAAVARAMFGFEPPAPQ